MYYIRLSVELRLDDDVPAVFGAPSRVVLFGGGAAAGRRPVGGGHDVEVPEVG